MTFKLKKGSKNDWRNLGKKKFNNYDFLGGKEVIRE